MEVDIKTTAGKLADLGMRMDEAVHASGAQAVVKQHRDIISAMHSVIALKAGEVRFFMKAPFMRRFAMRLERIWLMPSMGSVSYENMSSITVR